MAAGLNRGNGLSQTSGFKKAGTGLYSGSTGFQSGGSSAPPWDVLVTNDAELAAAIASSTGAPKTIALSDTGTFTAQANINSKTAITLRGQTYGVPTLPAGLTATSSTNCKVLGLKITRTAPDANANYAASGVVEAGSSTGLEIAYCEVASNGLAGIAMQDGSVAGQFFQGYRGINGTGMASFNFHHNTVHDTYRGFSVQVAAASTGYIEYNSIYDCYQNPAEMAGLAGGTLYFRHNDFIGTWAISTDTGSPHSSVLGFSATAAWTPIIVGNILIAGVDRRFAAKGTYAAASGPKFNDTTSNTMLYTNGVFAWNIVTAQDGIGLEVSLGNFAVFYNTVLKDNVTASALVPAHSYHDIGAGSYCCKNIFPNHLVGTLVSLGGPNGIHSDYYTLSWDNPILRPDNLGTTVAGDLNCYDVHLTGPTFSGWTVANIVGRVTPKVGSYFATDGIGAVGTGYDWTARSYSSFPTFTKPKTSNATGTTPALTQFDGTNDWLQMPTVTAPFLDIVNRRTWTVAFYATADAADTVDCYYAESSSTDFSIRRLPASSRNLLRIRLKNNAGAAICDIDTSGSGTGFTDGFGQRSADGATAAKRLWLFTVNLTTGRYFIMRGKELDPFPAVNTLKPDDYSNTRTSHAIMGQNDLTPPAGTGLMNGRLGLFYFTDEYINLNTAANHNSIVATDGTPADWGTGGANLTGTQPRGYVYGDAATLNAANGTSSINLGSSPDKWGIYGSVTNA